MKQITKKDINVRYVECLRSCHDEHRQKDRCDKCSDNDKKGCQYVIEVRVLREVLKDLDDYFIMWENALISPPTIQPDKAFVVSVAKNIMRESFVGLLKEGEP